MTIDLEMPVASIELPSPPHIEPRDALFLDFDGTLAGIASRPDAVVIAPYLPELLLRTRHILGDALALVSGRAIKTIDHLTQHSVQAVAGVHGLERRSTDGTLKQTPPAAPPILDMVRSILSEFAGHWPGVIIEDKGSALALHYRANPLGKSECIGLARRIAERSERELKLIEGDCVVEIMSRGSDKGDAVRAFLAEPPFLGRRPIFVGDDLTDETAFRTVIECGGIAVIVGTRRPTWARFGLPSVTAVHAWIGELSNVQGAWNNA